MESEEKNKREEIEELAQEGSMPVAVWVLGGVILLIVVLAVLSN